MKCNDNVNNINDNNIIMCNNIIINENESNNININVCVKW